MRHTIETAPNVVILEASQARRRFAISWIAQTLVTAALIGICLQAEVVEERDVWADERCLGLAVAANGSRSAPDNLRVIREHPLSDLPRLPLYSRDFVDRHLVRDAAQGHASERCL
jgi:hypothetical protein